MMEKKSGIKAKKLAAEIIIKDGRITICGHSDDFSPKEVVKALKEKGLELKENFNSPCG